MFHVANVVKLDSKDPEKDIIEPSVNGLKAVLSAMDKEPRVQCFVLTSSYAAIEVGIPKEVSIYELCLVCGCFDLFDLKERGPLTEADHNTAASVSWKPYSFSKVQTEKLAVEWSKERKEKNGSFRYASIHPPMILGPQLNGESLQSSSEVFEMILNGSYPFLPPLFFPMIDVRDCADAHVVCFEHPKAEGRYLTCNGHHWLMDLANFARETFPKYPIPSRTLYVWFFKFVGQFDKRMDKGLLQENTKECLHVDASKICKELGFEYKYSIKQATIDHCQSLIDHKLVKVIE